jgi:hypothetical protein
VWESNPTSRIVITEFIPMMRAPLLVRVPVRNAGAAIKAPALQFSRESRGLEDKIPAVGRGRSVTSRPSELVT